MAGLPWVRWNSKVQRTDTCWLWTGSLGTGGYGLFWDGQRNVRAHRWSYEQFVGPIPPGLPLDHLCRVRNCVNPGHLEPVSIRENVHRAIAAKYGEVQPEHGSTTGYVHRGCRCYDCRAAWAAYHRAKRAAKKAS